MRILWYSNAPWNGSGYGQQTALWAARLNSAGHETAVAAFHGLQGVPLHWNGITVYPGSSEDPFAQDVLLGHYHRHQASLLITLMDAWVLDPGKINEMIMRGVRLVHWLPVDCDPVSALDARILEQCGARPVAMSRFGQRMLEKYDPAYVPHGIDTTLFAPSPPDLHAESRARAGYDDMFLIGINAANQDPVRKGFGEQLEAFSVFAARHDDVRMLIHTRMATRQGISFDRLIAELGLQDKVRFGDQYNTAAGMTTAQELARWYGICDIMSNCSYGEGFGLPVIEAQACGTPVVVTDCSAMTELAGAGWKVPGQRYWNAGHSAWWTAPSVPAIVDAYEEAYAERGSSQAAARRAAAREFARQYDADTVLADYWAPLLKELDA